MQTNKQCTEQVLQQRVKTIISAIRIIRERKNYKQEYLAMKLNISQNAYSKIELGKHPLTINCLLLIAQVLETDVFELINFQISKLLTLT